MKLYTPVLAALLVFVLLPLPQAGGQPLTQALVTRIIDGDTFDAVVNGRGDRVRPIGVDAPETIGKAEFYGREATQFARRRLSGKTVWLERDVVAMDQYGRLLAYVWLEPPVSRTPGEIQAKMFNAMLLAEGYAQMLTIPPNVRYVDVFRVLQAEARRQGKGLWGPTPFVPAAPSATQTRCDPSYPDICIPPPPPDLDCGDIPHRRFRVLPPDPHRFDLDRDGIGCET